MEKESLTRLTGSKENRSQITLELAFALICIFILVIAAVRLSVWLIGRMVVRQEDYERTRPYAGRPGSLGYEVPEDDPTKYPKLKFFE